MSEYKCPDCPANGVSKDDGGFQCLSKYFHMRIVFRLLSERPRPAIPISREQGRGFGLVIDPDQIAEEAAGVLNMGNRSINEAHLAHIPAFNLSTPGIIAPLIVTDEKTAASEIKRGGRQAWEGPEATWMLMDGGHRLTKLFREGAEECMVYPLTAVETMQAQGQSFDRAFDYVYKNRAAFKDWPGHVREIAGVEQFFWNRDEKDKT